MTQLIALGFGGKGESKIRPFFSIGGDRKTGKLDEPGPLSGFVGFLSPSYPLF